MNDPDVVNIAHTLTLVALGIKHKIYDSDFLFTVAELLNNFGVEIFDKILNKLVGHLLASVSFNVKGENAANKQHR